MTDFAHDELISKTRRKRQMDELQDLGMRLTSVSAGTLDKIGLPEDLRQAVVDYRKISSNGALKRQAQYIGRLMRDIDPAPIRAFFARLDGDNEAHNAYMQRLEKLRARLIDDDAALTELLDLHPHLAGGEIRTLVRNARREAADNKPPKAFRALFRLLRESINETDDIA